MVRLYPGCPECGSQVKRIIFMNYINARYGGGSALTAADIGGDSGLVIASA
jgi:hypothetical protein